MLAEMGGLEQTLGMPNGAGRSRQSTGQKSAATQQFYQTLQKQVKADGDDLVKLDSEMTFD